MGGEEGVCGICVDGRDGRDGLGWGWVGKGEGGRCGDCAGIGRMGCEGWRLDTGGQEMKTRMEEG